MAKEYQLALEKAAHGLYGSEQRGIDIIARDFNKSVQQIKKDLKTVDGKIRE